MPVDNMALGFIGAGAMAEALLKSILRSGLIQADNIWASDLNPERVRYFRQEYGINPAADNRDLICQVRTVVYAVKPFVMEEVLAEVGAETGSGGLLHISVAAGISLGLMEKLLPAGSAVIRVMPNTPSLVGAGAAAYALGSTAGPRDEAVVRAILDAAGISVKVPEHLMNAVTGLSGSGPAYVFLILEALTDGGVKAGLPRDIAAKLAVQTILGAAKLVRETGEHPARLRDMVTTPGGTTIAGLHVLEEGGLRATMMNAVTAAARRAEELGKGK